MLSSVRKLLDNWVARGFFALLVAIFVFWGISNVFSLGGGSDAVAHVGGTPVNLSLVQAAYQTQLQQAAQAGNTQPDLPTRQQLAAAALNGVLRSQILQRAESAFGLAAPDAVIRAQIYAISAFQTNNVFDQAKFTQILQQNNKTPDQFIAEVKDSVLGSQLVLPVIGGVGPPGELTQQIFDYIAEQRFAQTVSVTAASQNAPPPPADAVLRRYWRNHQPAFAAPEYRQIKLVLLSPALLAPREQVSDAEIDAAYARATAGQQAVPLRSVQVITVPDPAKAAELAAVWQGGADWPKMQALAKQAGGNPIELDSARQAQFPSPQMGIAVFAAAPGAVKGPVPDAFGYFVFKVTQTASSIPSQAALQTQIKQSLQLQKAQAEIAQDVDNVQDALAGQTPLDQLPGNLNLAALQGTLDANGNTLDGTAAPIPGDATLKAAVVKAAFAAHPGDPARLITGPAGSYFALTVDKIIPPSVHPYAQVAAQVLAAWTADAAARAAEVKAAALMAAVNGGQSLDDAASSAGISITALPAVTRNAPPSGVSEAMVQALFTLKPGQAVMLPEGAGFTVAALSKIVKPAPADDPADYAQVQQSMAKSMQDDVAESLIAGLQARYNVAINQKLFAQIYQ